MPIKLVIYNNELKKEVYPTYPKDKWLGLMDSINELRQIAQDHSISGWINEYDLEFSNVICSNKHDL